MKNIPSCVIVRRTQTELKAQGTLPSDINHAKAGWYDQSSAWRKAPFPIGVVLENTLNY
jgi:hypothetical protein